MEERLTKKELYNYTNMDFYSIQLDWHSIYNKLAEFEDFMESLGCEELEELEHLIGYPRLIDGYDEQGKEINRTEFVTYKESFNEAFDKNKKLKQENKALKSKWNKLKGWVRFYGNTNTHQITHARCIFQNDILDKMQELEQGLNNV